MGVSYSDILLLRKTQNIVSSAERMKQQDKSNVTLVLEMPTASAHMTQPKIETLQTNYVNDVETNCVHEFTKPNEEILLEQIESLKIQLSKAGIEPKLEFISYEEGNQMLLCALEKAAVSDSSVVLCEVERWDTFIRNHPQYEIDLKEKNVRWELENEEKNKEALREQKNTSRLIFLMDSAYKNSRILD